MAEPIQEARELIAKLGKLMFDRFLTDTAGGNISVRVGDRICMTPRFSGSTFLWNLDPGQILVTDLQGNKIEGDGDISREAKAHYKLLNEFTDGKALVHSHPRHILALSTWLFEPMLPVLESTKKFGEVPVCSYATAHSGDLADHIAKSLIGKEAVIRKQAAAVIAPLHGLFVLGKDLLAAFDATERLDINAQMILLSAQPAVTYGTEVMHTFNKRLLELTGDRQHS